MRDVCRAPPSNTLDPFLPSEIVPEGHTREDFPHFNHSFMSISGTFSSMLIAIAFSWHASAQAEQRMQSLPVISGGIAPMIPISFI